jgi:predicted nucleotide-binding protein
MMHLRQAAEDLGRFVSAVRYVADRAGRFRPPSATELARLSITSEEIRLHLALEPGDRALLRLGALISQEAWQLWTSFAGPDSDGWSFEVNLERARRYRAIYTVIDFLAISYPEGQQPPSLPASPTSLGSTHALPTTDNKKVMVVHGRDKARDDLFNLLRALGLEPIEWSAAVKSTGTTKPYTGQAVEAAFATAQAAVILLVPEERVALRNDLRDPKDPSDDQMTWQPRPNVFYEGGIAVTSHPDQTIVLELGRPRTATDLAGVNTIRIGPDPVWRHNLANRLRDAGCPVNTEGADWLRVGEFAEPDVTSSG